MGHILYNDSFIPRESAHVDIEDRGYQFGDGIYEVIRIYEGKMFTFEEHLNRLKRSAQEISLQYAPNDLENKLKELISLNKIKNGYIYLQITRGVAPRVHHFPQANVDVQLTAYTRKMERPLKEQKAGVETILIEDIRWLRCDIKSLNLLGNILAKQQANIQQCYEAIQHRGPIVTEGSSSNAYIVQDGVIYTHPTTNLILNGITRLKILELCKKLKLDVHEEAYTVEQLLNADEVFITSTISEVMPVTKVNNQEIGSGIPGPITIKLQQAFEKLIFA